MSQRTKILLGLLAVVIVLLLWRQFKPAPKPSAKQAAASRLEQASGDRATRPRRTGRSGEEPEAVSTVTELRLADLEMSSGGFRAGRNPFAFAAPPPPPAPPPPRPPTAAELAAKQAAEELARQAMLAAQAAQAVEAAKPRPPAITFSYVGSFGPPNRRIAVLSDGVTTYNAMVGDVIDGKFRLEAIGFESIDIGFVNFPDLPPAQLPVGEKGS